MKCIAKTPLVEFDTYKKFGNLPTKYQKFICPKCKNVINAGPNYQPRYCSSCGQKLKFDNIEYVNEEHKILLENKLNGKE